MPDDFKSAVTATTFTDQPPLTMEAVLEAARLLERVPPPPEFVVVPAGVTVAFGAAAFKIDDDPKSRTFISRGVLAQIKHETTPVPAGRSPLQFYGAPIREATAADLGFLLSRLPQDGV